MPETRSRTGNSKPRVFAAPEPVAAPTTKRGPKKSAATGAKANTSKPRDKKTASGRVAKATKKATKDVKEKVEKAVGKTETEAEKAVDKTETKAEGESEKPAVEKKTTTPAEKKAATTKKTTTAAAAAPKTKAKDIKA